MKLLMNVLLIMAMMMIAVHARQIRITYAKQQSYPMTQCIPFLDQDEQPPLYATAPVQLRCNLFNDIACTVPEIDDPQPLDVGPNPYPVHMMLAKDRTYPIGIHCAQR